MKRRSLDYPVHWEAVKNGRSLSLRIWVPNGWNKSELLFQGQRACVSRLGACEARRACDGSRWHRSLSDQALHFWYLLLTNQKDWHLEYQVKFQTPFSYSTMSPASCNCIGWRVNFTPFSHSYLRQQGILATAGPTGGSHLEWRKDFPILTFTFLKMGSPRGWSLLACER